MLSIFVKNIMIFINPAF